MLFGLAALLRPDIALGALILLFGAYALVDGVFAIVDVFGGTRSGTPRWVLLVEGVAGVLAGLLAFILPRMTALVLLYLIAVWSIVTGVFQAAAVVRLRREIRGEWALVAGGLVSVLFGIVLAVLPAVGILSLVWLVGIYAVAFGVLLLISAFRIRRNENAGSAWRSRVT